MQCIYCSADTQVINSRPQKRLNQVWRRRKCTECKALFTSHEAASYDDAWRIQAANGKLAPFMRDKLFLSLHKSCGHREQAVADTTALTDTIISHLRNKTNNGLLTPATIAKITLTTLQNFDKPAATHYLAFHPVSK